MGWEPDRTDWPDTVPVDQARLIESIGWPALMMVCDGRFSIQQDSAGQAVGLRLGMKRNWWLVVVGTADGYSIGRYRAMVPFEWRHGLPLDALTHDVQEMAALASYTSEDDDE